MKNLFLSMVCLTAVVSFASTGLTAPPGLKTILGQRETINWQSDLQAAHKEALEQNKPIMIVFGAEWCGYCKKLERQTLSDPKMVEYVNENFVAVHLDLDKERKIGQVLEVNALPCTVVLTPNAELLGRISGYQTPAPFKKNLSTARDRFESGSPVVPTKGVLR